jgi:hypothetical protein
MVEVTLPRRSSHRHGFRDRFAPCAAPSIAEGGGPDPQRRTAAPRRLAAEPGPSRFTFHEYAGRDLNPHAPSGAHGSEPCVSAFHHQRLERTTGLEPATSCMASRCAANCATSARRPGFPSADLERIRGTGHRLESRTRVLIPASRPYQGQARTGALGIVRLSAGQ